MKRSALRIMYVAVLFGSTQVTQMAHAAGQSSITLQAKGTINAAPKFKDADDNTLTTAPFNFDNNLAGNANRDIDSQSFQMKLVGAKAYPASVDLVMPASCTIGNAAVNNAHVNFSHDGVVSSANGAFNIASAALFSYYLRFAAAGNYGDKDGAVSCSAPGSLTYQY